VGVAPISWGISGVSAWGYQLPAGRVLAGLEVIRRHI
jgi:hypothetical protein